MLVWESLEIKVRDVNFLPEDLHFEQLERYIIIVGNLTSWWGFDVTRKFYLELSSTSINNLQHGVKMLFKSTECLYLGELKGIKNVLPALDVDGFPKLKHLQIERDDETQYVVNVEDKQRNVAFPCLESLKLIDLHKLQKICNGPLMIESFCNLTNVEVENCNKLERLFSFSMATTRLPRLQVIMVTCCNALEAIVAEKNIHDDGVNINDGVCEEIEFAQLRKLYISELPKLKNFFSNGDKSLSPEIITRDEEEELKSSFPFFTKVAFLKLQKLELHGIFNLTLIWSHKFQEISCNNLTTLTISGCNSLKHVFPTYVAPYLNILEYLELKDCEEVEVLIGDENREKGEIINATQHERDVATFIFAKLTTVCLHNLPKVECFYSREHTIECPALTNIKVNDSGKLSALDFFSFSEKQGDKLSEKVMSKLEGFTVRNNELMKILQLYHHFPTHLFSSLIRLSIVEFHGGSVVFSLVSFKSLEELTISGCEMMEKVIGDNDNESSRDDNEIIFPNLWRLTLERLPRLTSFCSSTNYSFNFPILIYVTVRNCPNMKTFCGGTTTTPELIVEYDYQRRWEGDLNTTVQKIFSEMEAKRLSTALPSTLSSNHVESTEELTEPIPMVVQNATNPEKESEVYENSNESRKGIETREEGKEVEVSEITRHSDPSTHNYTNREQTVAGSVASSSKPSSHSEGFPKLTTTLPSNSHSYQEAEIHEKAAESTKEHQNYTDKEQTIAASQHVVASSEETNPPAETSLSLSTQLEVPRSTPTVESEATTPRKAGETWNRSDMENPARTSSSMHFIPLLSEFLQIIQNQPLKSMSAEHVQFMEDAFRDLSNMNFSIEWFNPYVEKARECLPVLESTREISELESEIAKMEAELEAVKEKKKALEEKYEGVTSRIDLDKSLHHS